MKAQRGRRKRVKFTYHLCVCDWKGKREWIEWLTDWEKGRRGEGERFSELVESTDARPLSVSRQGESKNTHSVLFSYSSPLPLSFPFNPPHTHIGTPPLKEESRHRFVPQWLSTSWPYPFGFSSNCWQNPRPPVAIKMRKLFEVLKSLWAQLQR